MPGNNALRQRFSQIFDRIFVGERAESWRFRMRAVTLLPNGVTARAVIGDKRLAFGGQVLVGR